MKNNRSLAVSVLLNNELRSGVMLGIMGQYIKDDVFDTNDSVKRRDRVFSPKNTLETMLLAATLEDKSLKNSVSQFYIVHQKKRELLEEQERYRIEKKKEELKNRAPSKGRPAKFDMKIGKSKMQDISLNTAAYSNARKRLHLETTEKLFKSTVIEDFKNDYSHWKNYKVLIADGTYLQLQDTPEVREGFPIEKNVGSYPQALLEAFIARGTGQIINYKIDGRNVSELSLANKLLDDVQENKYILLADDLYNAYEIMSKCISKKTHFVFPAKRKRNFILIESFGKGDDIIEITSPEKRGSWADKQTPLSDKIKLRRIECFSPEGKQYVLFTSVLDRSITKEEIQMLYLTRWDIEISIREIKTIMNINVLRSKTPEMLKKELNVSLAAYNIIRNITYASLKDLPFSPKEDFIYEFYSLNKNILIDKKGRIYSKWSTGRKRTKNVNPSTSST